MLNPFIAVIGQILPLIISILSAAPAPKVETTGGIGSFNIRNDTAGVADAIHIAQFLPSGGALHHAGVSIACMEDGVVGIHEGHDFFLHSGKDGRLLIAAFRDHKGKD